MIKFNKNENNKQFISISIEDGTDVIKVFNYISALYPAVSYTHLTLPTKA